MSNGGELYRGECVDLVFATTIARTTEAFVNPVAAEMAARGYRVQLIAGDRAPEADFEHTSAVLPMHRGMSPRADLSSIGNWVSHLRSVKPRMVVAGTPKASALCLTAARMAAVPARVYVIHGAVWDGASGSRRLLLECAERTTISCSTHQLAVSDSLARLVHARGLSPRMPDVLGSGSFSGVDVERFSPSNSSARPSLKMCYIGRLHRDKGIDALFRILDRVRETVDASLTVVGGIDATAPPDPQTMDLLVHHPQVDWVGEVADVAAYLQNSSILLLPTAREGLPQVALEAQACGVPVVSWRATGVIDAVRDGFTGILVPFGDEDGLALAAAELLTSGPMYGRLSTNGRHWSKSRFGREEVVSRTADYLEGPMSAGLASEILGVISTSPSLGARMSRRHS